MWKVDQDKEPGHDDFIEQGGRGAGQVVYYHVGDDRVLSLKRSVIWPSLRINPNNTHGSLIHSYGREAEPAISIDGTALGPLTATTAILDGTLTFQCLSARGIAVERCTFPATSSRAVIERWTLRNTGGAPVTVAIGPLALEERLKGPYGVNVMAASHDAPASTVLAPGRAMAFAITFHAHLDGEPAVVADAPGEEAARRAFVGALLGALRLETPDPILDRAFAMAKIRVAESINKTRGGLMLAPGGLSYYAATWCNDNVEYAGPFFPFLGDQGGNQASLDSYRGYVPYMTADYHAIPSSIVAEGTSFWNGAGDRGDAAMYAYGCPRFCLARGDRAIAEELWPAISLVPRVLPAADPPRWRDRLQHRRARRPLPDRQGQPLDRLPVLWRAARGGGPRPRAGAHRRRPAMRRSGGDPRQGHRGLFRRAGWTTLPAPSERPNSASACRARCLAIQASPWGWSPVGRVILRSQRRSSNKPARHCGTPIRWRRPLRMLEAASRWPKGPGGYGTRNARNAGSIQLTVNFIPRDTNWRSTP